jgi:hypothetical protein
LQVEEGRVREETQDKLIGHQEYCSKPRSIFSAQGSNEHDSDCERAFDIADCLEQGLACEVVTDFMHPLRRSSKLWRFNMVRSQDRLQYRLFTEEGDFLMYAHAMPEVRKVQFHLYNPDDKDSSSLFDPTRPAFSMSWSESRSEWRLVQEKCENCQFSPRHLSCACCGKQQVAFIKHTRKCIHDAIFNLMDVRLPGLYSDESRVVWCPKLGRGDLGSDTLRESSEWQRLVTKTPVWNDEVGSLLLDFKGRSVTPSAKNFQLAFGKSPEHAVCQCGKIGDDKFSLDFKYPLSVVQAFGISLSTIFWA